ncbi:MAG: TonB-dependent receptor, partial [Gammaproteobacteria bacterium]
MSKTRLPGPRALAACLLAAAAGLPPAAGGAALPGPEVVVTATRTARTADQSLASVQVIDRAAIEASGALTLPQLLEGLGGADLVTSGGPFGKQASLFLDGMESDHVLVLVDGVRAGSVSAGGFAWELLPLDQVERIEIVRGPRSALYGSEAVAGVIQIFTRRGGERSRSAALGAGRYATYRLRAAAQGGGRKRPWALSLAQLGSRGFDATTSGTEPDRDSYRNLSLGGSAELPLGTARLGLHGLGATGRTRYDGYRDRDDYLQGAWSARLELPGTDRWQPTLLAGASRDRRQSVKEAGGVPSALFDSRRWTFSWQNDLAVGETGLLTLGVDHYLDR